MSPLLLAVVLAGAPGAASQARLDALAEAFTRASSSQLGCASLTASLTQAEQLAASEKKPRPDEWGRPLRFSCAKPGAGKSTVCSDGPDRKPGTKDDLCAPLEASKDAPPLTEAGVKMLKDFGSLTQDFAVGYRCEDLKSELASMRVGDSWRRLLRVDCRWRLVCSDGPDGVQATPDDLCYPMR